MANLTLEKYVQRKVRCGREFFYFRVVRSGKEERIPLPHPFEAGYRAAYDGAHVKLFGIPPGLEISPTSVIAMARDHRQSARYLRLPPTSKNLRDLASALIVERWGVFEASAIRPIHVQALYDSLTERPATANRRLDDISAIFGWSRTRGFCDENPCIGIERVENEGSYEPWPNEALTKLITEGRPEIVKVALVGIYTSQRRGDVLLKLTDASIDEATWYLRQGKTKTEVPVPLHPVVLSILDLERAERRRLGILDPRRPLLTNSRGKVWTSSGFGASWRTELIRLGLRPDTNREYVVGDFQPTFHGLRHTSATLIANAVAQNPATFGGIERVKSMLGHLSAKMARHYARRAATEHLNAETILLLPTIGNTPSWIGNIDEEDAVSH